MESRPQLVVVQLVQVLQVAFAPASRLRMVDGDNDTRHGASAEKSGTTLSTSCRVSCRSVCDQNWPIWPSTWGCIGIGWHRYQTKTSVSAFVWKGTFECQLFDFGDWLVLLGHVGSCWVHETSVPKQLQSDEVFLLLDILRVILKHQFDSNLIQTNQVIQVLSCMDSLLRPWSS